MITYGLTAANWKEQTELASMMLTEAVALDLAYGGLNTWVNSAHTYITQYGQSMFNTAIPGIATFVPSIFYSSYSLPEVTRTNYTSVANGTKGGTNLVNAGTGVGAMFGVNFEWGALLISGFGFIMLAGLIYSITKSAAAGIVIGFAGLMVVVWVGFGTMLFQLLLVVFVTVAMLFAIYFWNSRM
jgi:hypothetical protein